jgi:gliding motility-associated-like protein
VAQEPGTYTADIFTATCEGKAANQAVVSAGTAINFDAVVTEPTCTNANGSITINNISGGTDNNYQFSRDNGATFQSQNIFNNLPPGEYTIIVKDGGGCESSSQSVAIKNFTSTLKATTTVTNIACNQRLGLITVFASGGTLPYRFSINDGTGQTLNVFTGLAAGTYTITVEDAAGCRVTINATIGITNSSLEAKAVVTDATCREKGFVTIEASGGEAPYQYKIDGGSYQASGTFKDLESGTRKVTVKDNAGCEFEVSFEIRESAGNPNLNINNPPRICPETTANLRDSSIFRGSDLGLTYTFWLDSSATRAVTNPEAVSAGTYYIKAANGGGCFTVKPVVVTPYTNPAGNIIVQGPPVACNGRPITLTASSGNAYQWYRNDTAIDGATERSYKAMVSGVYSVSIDYGTCIVRALNTANLRFQECAAIPETNVFVPTAFTPNKNGENDVLRPILYNIASLRYFKVYNRWGQVVFETNEMGKGWDGTIKGSLQPTETYSWILQCTDNNGNVIKKSGRSLLIR